MVKTITGTDMKVFIGIKNIYVKDVINKTPEQLKTLGNQMTWYDAGTVIQIRFAAQRDVNPKYSLTSLDPISLSSGVVFTQGDMIFKNFNQDSVKALFNAIILENAISGNSTLNENAKNTVNAFDLTNGGFTDQVASDLSSSTNLSKAFSKTIENWDEMPYLDIKIIAKSSDYATTSDLVFMDIMDVKITDVGFSEGIDSTEVNDVVKFIAVGGINSWKKIKKGSEF